MKVLEVYLEDLPRVIEQRSKWHWLKRNTVKTKCLLSSISSRLNQTYSWCSNWNWSTKLLCLHRDYLVSNSSTLYILLFRCWRICDLPSDEFELKTFIMFCLISSVHLLYAWMFVWSHVLHLYQSCIHALRFCDDLVSFPFLFLHCDLRQILQSSTEISKSPIHPPSGSKPALSATDNFPKPYAIICIEFDLCL